MGYLCGNNMRNSRLSRFRGKVYVLGNIEYLYKYMFVCDWVGF